MEQEIRGYIKLRSYMRFWSLLAVFSYKNSSSKFTYLILRNRREKNILRTMKIGEKKKKKWNGITWESSLKRTIKEK